MITIRQVEAFRAVMLTNSMTRAAAVLSITQSAVSKIIHEMEAELGFVLFARRKGGLQPSSEATALFAEVERSFIGLERIMRAAQRIHARHGGQLRIAAMPALTTMFLPQVTARFIARGRELEVSIDTFNSSEVADLVASGNADIGFAMTPIDNARVQSGKVMQADCVCILPPGHRLARNTIVELKDFEDEPFISLARDTTTRITIDSAFRAANIRRDLKLEARWSLSVAALVSQGAGLAIIEPFSARLFEAQGGIVKRLRERIEFSFVQVLPKHVGIGPLAETYLELFVEEFEKFVSDEKVRHLRREPMRATRKIALEKAK